ncbi:FAD-dependent oxidoreductase [Rhodococcus jostii]|uniref:ferredoxin--NADP(+) reductase n=1 Tax=Rhodococcus jostii TaxID=132919 RepID=A0A1H5LZI9_RHOJO|nr:FAD-dependent oxidoreductase [Rhodococcus jostii]SEE82555.1 ferredoxin--NADP+ reductase [Rhodococcus jostii]
MTTPGAGARQPSVAIVGSGPSGCYLAQFLRKRWRESDIVVFDRLDTPYGLVRYGVAPDHPGTRAVSKQFDRLFQRESIRFVGSTLISTIEGDGDLTLGQLRGSFDIVVLATGLHADRALAGPGGPLPGAELSGVYGAGRLTRLINGHPEEKVDDLSLGRRVLIVGHGNVAIDLLRLFLTPAEQLRALGIANDVVDAITAGPVREIDIVGRSQPAQAKFDVAMVRELEKLSDVAFEAHGVEVEPDEQSTRHEAIATLAAGSDDAAGRVVRFHFGWEPIELTGVDSVSGIVLLAMDGSRSTVSMPADAVCTAIGFAEHDTAPLRRADHEHIEHIDLERGILGDNLFCVGWLRRGPRGTIPENRVDARMVSDTIIASYAERSNSVFKPGASALDIQPPITS